MKYITDRGILPEKGSSIRGSICEETAIRGEGHFPDTFADRGSQEKFVIKSTPYNNHPLMGKGKPGESGKE